VTRLFIQDREETDSKPRHGTRYVIVSVEQNGDIEHLAYSDDEDEILKMAQDLNLVPVEETSAGYDLEAE